MHALYAAKVEEVKGIFNLSTQYVAVFVSWGGQKFLPRKEQRSGNRESYFKTKAEALGWLVDVYTTKVKSLTSELKNETATMEYLVDLHRQELGI